MGVEWRPAGSDNAFEGVDRKTRQPKWTATRVDLIFSARTRELRALAEAYGCADAQQKFSERLRRRPGLQRDETPIASLTAAQYLLLRRSP